MLLLAILLLPAALHRRLAASWRLVRRSRWLFLLILLGYAYSLPGTAVWAGLGEYAPTWQGLREGGMQAARLLLLLLLLDRLVLSLSEEYLLAGLHRLFAGLRRLGIDADRLTVRLALTLRMMEANCRSGRMDIGDLLGDLHPSETGSAQLSLPCLPWRGLDGIALGLAVGLLLYVWLRA